MTKQQAKIGELCEEIRLRVWALEDSRDDWNKSIVSEAIKRLALISASLQEALTEYYK